MAFKMRGAPYKNVGYTKFGPKSAAYQKNDSGPTDANKAKMQSLMKQFQKATDPQDKLRIKNQMEKLAGM